MNLRSAWTNTFSWLANLGVSKAAAGYGGGGGGPIFTDRFQKRRAPTKYELVQAYKGLAYTCSRINASAICRQPLRLYATTGGSQARPKGLVKSGRRDLAVRNRVKMLARSPSHARWISKADDVDEVAEHPLLKAVDEVNQDFDRNLLLEYTSICLDMVGRFAWEPEWGGPGNLTIWPLQAQYLFPVREGSLAKVAYYQYFDRKYDPAEIINSRMISATDPYALCYSPAEATWEGLGIDDAYLSVQQNLLDSGVRPSLLISNKDANLPMGEVERKRSEDAVNRRLSGGGAGRAWFVDGALEVTPLNFPPTDMAALGLDDAMLRRISIAWGVPLPFLTGETNLANLQAAEARHAKDAVEPRCQKIAAALTTWTHWQNQSRTVPGGRQLGWDRLFWAFDNPVQEDRESDAKIFDMKIKSGVITINEVRAEDGLEAVEWGDEPWLAQTLVQPSQAEENREIARKLAEKPVDAKPTDGQPDVAEGASETEAEQGPAGKAFREGEDGDFFPPRITPRPSGSSIASPPPWAWPTGTWTEP